MLAFLSDDATFSKIKSILAHVENGKETIYEMVEMREGRLADPTAFGAFEEPLHGKQFYGDNCDFLIEEHNKHSKQNSKRQSVPVEIHDNPLQPKDDYPLIKVLDQNEQKNEACKTLL